MITIKNTEVTANEFIVTIHVDARFPELATEIRNFAHRRAEEIEADLNPCHQCNDNSDCRDCPHEEEALDKIAEEMKEAIDLYAKDDEQKYREFLEHKNADPHEQVHEEHDRMAEKYHEPIQDPDEPAWDQIAEHERNKKRENDAAMYYDSHQEPPWE